MFTLRTTWVSILQVTIYLCVMTEASEPVGQPSQDFIIKSPSKIPYVESPINIQCPDAQEIHPCVCSIHEDQSMEMDCSDISSEEELRDIFNKQFPFTTFNKLRINSNKNLKTLRAGDLGKSSFSEIAIINGVLEEIEDLALMSSDDTLELLYVSNNNLEFLPDISPFNKLRSLDAFANAFTLFPVLSSFTLDYLSLNNNQIETVPAGVIRGLPSLKNLDLFRNSISQILSGAFTDHTSLEYIALSENNLTTLPQNAIQLHGSDSSLYIHDNHITHLPPGSFSGVTGTMLMHRNSLEEMDELVWRPLLEEEVSLTLSGNPFGCGCDIAWLILNRTLLDRVGDDPTCSDGRAFVDLDPAYYEEMC